MADTAEQAIQAAVLSATIGLIYDCAIDPSRWPIAMEAMRAVLGFRISTLNLQVLPSFEIALKIATNVEPRFVAAIDRAGPDIAEVWGGAGTLMSLPLDEPLVLSRVNPDFASHMLHNRYYLEFAKPQGLVDVLAIGLARDAHGLGSLGFGRHEEEGPIGEHEIGLARLFVPHLQRAATINRMLDRAALERARYGSVLDAMTIPLVMTEADLKVVHANPAAERLLGRSDPIRCRDGRLAAAGLGASRALATAVAQAGADESAIGRKGLSIPLRSRDGTPSALHVLPLGRRLGGTHPGAVAAVFIAKPEARFVPPTRLAAALFDLTPAEARVFASIAAGHGVTAASAELGVSPSTVRTHLLRLYEKIGVRRQAGLVQVARSLDLPFSAA